MWHNEFYPYTSIVHISVDLLGNTASQSETNEPYNNWVIIIIISSSRETVYYSKRWYKLLVGSFKRRLNSTCVSLKLLFWKEHNSSSLLMLINYRNAYKPAKLYCNIDWN